jgi:hypothetical protein
VIRRSDHCNHWERSAQKSGLSGFGFRASAFGLRLSGFGLRASGFSYRFQISDFRFQKWMRYKYGEMPRATIRQGRADSRN